MAKAGRPTRYAASVQRSCACDEMPIAAAQYQQKFARSDKIHFESVPADLISPLSPARAELRGGRYGVTGDQKLGTAAAVLGSMAARTRWTPCRPRAPDASPSSGRDDGASVGKCCCQESSYLEKKCDLIGQWASLFIFVGYTYSLIQVHDSIITRAKIRGLKNTYTGCSAAYEQL